MTTQTTTDTLINDFVDDINAGVVPRIWMHLSEHPEDADKLIPMMKAIGNIRATSITVSSQDKEAIREAILRRMSK